MNTVFLLMAEFNTPHPKLSDVCEKYFGLSVKEAAERGRGRGKKPLPVKIFRCGSQKSEWLVDVTDLARHIDECKRAAYSEAS